MRYFAAFYLTLLVVIAGGIETGPRSSSKWMRVWWVGEEGFDGGAEKIHKEKMLEGMLRAVGFSYETCQPVIRTLPVQTAMEIGQDVIRIVRSKRFL
jgi:hypothetical protein